MKPFGNCPFRYFALWNFLRVNFLKWYFVFKIPGTEGRAGMVALVDNTKTLDLDKLCKGLKDNLPSYAVPLFVRVMDSVPMTGTFKLKKTDLQQEGFDIEKVKDRLFLYDAKNVTYVELTHNKYNDIMTGKIRL
jgi:solute carrier family 27 fatty acid transporter 1/4